MARYIEMQSKVANRSDGIWLAALIKLIGQDIKACPDPVLALEKVQKALVAIVMGR